MNAIQIHTLLLNGSIDVRLLTLSQGKPLIFRYRDHQLTIIPSSNNETNPVPTPAFQRIYDRYMAAPLPQRTEASYYNTSQWSDAPDRNYSPWIMRLIHYFETGN